MAKKYLDSNGLAYLWEKIKNLASGKVDKETGKGLSSNDYTSAEKTKLSGIATGAQVNVLEGIQVGGDSITPTNKIANVPVMTGASASAAGSKGVVPAPAAGAQGKYLRGDGSWQTISEGEPNQNAFSNVKVGTTTVAADTTTDTLELVAGSNVTLTPDATNDKVTIAATDTTYSEATTSAAGLMSSGDKTKLNGIATGAEVNQNAFSNVKVGTTTVAADAKTDTLELVAGSNVTLTPDATNDKVTIAATDTTYSEATTSAAGLMSSSDKTKLDGIATGAEVNQNAFSNIKVGTTTVEADGKTDTLELEAGTNITLTPDATNDKVTIATNAEVNQNAFSKLYYRTNSSATSNSLAREAGAKQESFGIFPGTNISMSQVVKNSVYGVEVTGPSNMTQTEATTGTATTGRAITPKVLHDTIAGFGGVANGFATLDSSGLVPSSQLPSYVDDVIEAYARSGQTELSSTWLATESASGTVITPETGKIYILMADSGNYSANDQFRWSGTTYVKMADGGVSAITNAEIDTICV